MRLNYLAQPMVVWKGASAISESDDESAASKHKMIGKILPVRTPNHEVDSQ